MKWDNGYFFPLAFILAVAGGIISWTGGAPASGLSDVCYLFAFLSFMTWSFREY